MRGNKESVKLWRMESKCLTGATDVEDYESTMANDEQDKFRL
jgi:hypothetical protein